MSVIWRCNACSMESLERMATVYVYENGRDHNRGSADVTCRLDLCVGCAVGLAKHLVPRGSRRRGLVKVPCGVCGKTSRALVQLYMEGMTGPARYDYAGKLCPEHIAPLAARGYKPSARARSTRRTTA